MASIQRCRYGGRQRLLEGHMARGRARRAAPPAIEVLRHEGRSKAPCRAYRGHDRAARRRLARKFTLGRVLRLLAGYAGAGPVRSRRQRCVCYRRGGDILCRFLGKMPLTKLSVATLERAYGDMLARGKRVRNRPGGTKPLFAGVDGRSCTKRCRRLCQRQCAGGGCRATSPRKSRPPRVEAKRVKMFSPDDVARQLRAAQSDPDLSCMLAVLLSVGCRRGELLGIGADSLGRTGRC